MMSQSFSGFHFSVNEACPSLRSPARNRGLVNSATVPVPSATWASSVYAASAARPSSPASNVISPLRTDVSIRTSPIRAAAGLLTR